MVTVPTDNKRKMCKCTNTSQVSAYGTFAKASQPTKASVLCVCGDRVEVPTMKVEMLPLQSRND